MVPGRLGGAAPEPRATAALEVARRPVPLLDTSVSSCRVLEFSVLSVYPADLIINAQLTSALSVLLWLYNLLGYFSPRGTYLLNSSS